MVAYSFRKPFVTPIQVGRKRQTYRSERKRHVRPGEPMQVYHGMRTRHCRKLLDPDPICTAVRHAVLEIAPPATIARAEIDGVAVPLTAEFAERDGFYQLVWSMRLDPSWVGGRRCKVVWGHDPLAAMGAYWRWSHGLGRWEGVLITWEAPHPGAYPRWQ